MLNDRRILCKRLANIHDRQKTIQGNKINGIERKKEYLEKIITDKEYLFKPEEELDGYDKTNRDKESLEKGISNLERRISKIDLEEPEIIIEISFYYDLRNDLCDSLAYLDTCIVKLSAAYAKLIKKAVDLAKS